MDNLKRLRSTLRASFTRISKKVTDYLEEEIRTEVLVQLQAQLEDRHSNLEELNSQIVELLVQAETTTQEEFDKELAVIEEYRDEYLELKTKMEFTLESLKSKPPPTSEETVEVTASKRKFKLPKIELKQFSGEIKDWLCFWAQYEKIHEDKDIPNEDKYQYLIQSTLKGSRAREIVESFPPTAANYLEAVDCLKRRFGRPDMLIEVYIRELLGLVMNNAVGQLKLPLVKLYDRIETYLRSLKMLDVTSDKYASMIYPLVESSLPADLLRVWERSFKSQALKSDPDTDKSNKLESLMTFLRNEIEGEEKVNLATSGFGIESHAKTYRTRFTPQVKNVPSAAELFSSPEKSVERKRLCVFCDKYHWSSECKYALSLSIENRKQILIKKGACFKCLNVSGHISRFCRAKVSCSSCKRQHYFVMCSAKNELAPRNEPSPEKSVNINSAEGENATLTNTCMSQILLQTLVVRIRQGNIERKVRVLIDSGSQRSYISKYAAGIMGYNCIREETLTHNLFGGEKSIGSHKRYLIRLGDINNTYNCNFEVLDQEKICTNIGMIAYGDFMHELKQRRIFITDMARHHDNLLYEMSPTEIHVLIGADVAGKLFTGKVENLKSGLVCIHTRLGWTMMGKISEYETGNSTNVVLSLHVSEAQISDLWRLDTLGILDPGEKGSRKDLEDSTRKHFTSTLKRNKDGRYVVSLPWIKGHPLLPTYKSVAEKRLKSCIESLKRTCKLKAYESVFQDWEDEEIISEIAPAPNEGPEHFLAHRAVFKENSTTPIRPIFDGSAKCAGSPSINDCLYKGPNMIELIPSILNRFRLRKFGVTSDIRKAFLQIGLSEPDRPYLKFLWWEGGNKEKVKIFQHNRVVFGITCSPYLLGATIENHLQNVPEQFQKTASLLLESFYIDNCLLSVNSEDELAKLIWESKLIMQSAQFDLRGWEYTSHSAHSDQLSILKEKIVPVLGLNWQLREDSLSVYINEVIADVEPITKRKILSAVHQIFDPIGFTCPVTLSPKILLQNCWSLKIPWDGELPEPIVKKFREWRRHLSELKEVSIPRCLIRNPDDPSTFTLHVFCDASKIAYATCIYLRSEGPCSVSCRLVQARSRVAPLKSITIPRLELLACNIGARLALGVKNDLKMQDIQTCYWSDSSNALYWIKKHENWSPFIYNRVQEIRSLSDPKDWNHIPGHLNPADLPSRGCTPKVLVESKWHEGPEWLEQPREEWPVLDSLPDLDIVNSEKRKTVISVISLESQGEKFYDRVSSYNKLVNIIAWIFRFVSNAKVRQEHRAFGGINALEVKQAEISLLKLVQRESFVGPEDKRLKTFQIMIDQDGILKIKTRILRREDSKNFRFPIVLPYDHPVVTKLIFSRHVFLDHAGVQMLMTNLREDYWILKFRKAVRKVVWNCVQCRKFDSRPFEAPIAPLPADRVRDAAVFEIIGVDLAGPLILKGGQKCWIVLYTCAIFRAVHFELVTSLTTENFLQSFKRFIARRGRPSVVYSDQATNFSGANNSLNRIDWEIIEKYSAVNKIVWKFNPPTAPWWGGWWERIVGMVKRILRKVLGKSSLNFEEMNTVVCDCESIINNRPLTYVSDDVEDLITLTPSMFLQEIKEVGTPDLDALDASQLNRRYAYRLRLRQDLRLRFRSEYLGQLKQSSRTQKRDPKRVQVGDIVVVGSDDKKRLDWPLARIIALYPSSDGWARLVKLRMKGSEFLRPIDRLFPLEVSHSGDPLDPILMHKRRFVPTSEIESEIKASDDSLSSAGANQRINHPRSRYGREIKPVKRLIL